MPTPFPGMDPYLKHHELWQDVHNSLVTDVRDYLAPRFRPRYYVSIEQRTYRAGLTGLSFVGRPVDEGYGGVGVWGFSKDANCDNISSSQHQRRCPMSHHEFTLTTADGTQFYFQGWEPETPAKAAVCLVHGLGEHSGRYAHVAAALNAAGYALLAFDLRGHGKSGGPRGHTPSYDALMDDIGRLLDEAGARYPGRPLFLYGHSLGGNLVLNYALRRQPAIAGVVSTSPAIRTANPPPALQLALGKIMYGIKPDMQMANGLALDGLARDPEVIRAYTSDPLVHNKISVRLALDMLQAGEWALAHAAEFPLPLLLVHGSADKLTSAAASQEFAARVRGDCTLKLWDGFYHETHNEPEKGKVLGFMVDWLQKRTPP